MLRRTSLVVGIILLFVFLYVFNFMYSLTGLADDGSTGSFVFRLMMTLLVAGIPGIVAVVLLAISIPAEVRARRFNRQDWETAMAAASRCDALLQRPSHEAYISPGVREFAPERLVEVERHFDQRTAGDVQGAVTHQFSMFGASLNAARSAGSNSAVGAGIFSGAIKGLSDVHLNLRSTSRHDLMGDAIFALFETRDASGSPDTLRVTALSHGAVREWVQGLVVQTAYAVGMDTHTGTTIAAYSDHIAGRFAPPDVSYLSDRLHLVKSQIDRGERAVHMVVSGVPSGRGAIVATSARIGGADSLRIFPTAFPAMWGDAVGHALTGPPSGGQIGTA